MRKSAGDWGVEVIRRLDEGGGSGDEVLVVVVGEWKWNEAGKRVIEWIRDRGRFSVMLLMDYLSLSRFVSVEAGY